MKNQDILKKRYQLRRAAGVCVLLDMEQVGMPYRKPIVLNEMGADIWEALMAGQTVAQIGQHMAEQYEVPAEEAARDVASFVQQLQAQVLLETE